MKLPVTQTRIQTRYSDTDAMGHISSGSYVTFMQVGRLDFFNALEELVGSQLQLVVANIAIDYFRECFYGDDIEVISWCSEKGNKSLKVSNNILANGKLVAKGSAVNVGFDMKTRQSAALPEEWVISDYTDEFAR